MTGLRRLLAHRRWLAAWLVAATLAVRVLVPGGYMPGGNAALTLVICPGHVPAASMAGMDHHHDHGQQGDHDDRADQACPFAALALPTVAGGGGPTVVAQAATVATSPVASLADARAPPRRGYLRPPLRGPPSLG